jgi:hypothetical protein
MKSEDIVEGMELLVDSSVLRCPMGEACRYLPCRGIAVAESSIQGGSGLCWYIRLNCVKDNFCHAAVQVCLGRDIDVDQPMNEIREMIWHAWRAHKLLTVQPSIMDPTPPKFIRCKAERFYLGLGL